MSDANPRAPAGRQTTDRDVQADDESPDEIDASTDATDPLAIPVGDRQTSSLSLLKTEAKLAAEGGPVGNAATPVTTDLGEQLFEWLDKHDDDLEAAWVVAAKQRADECHEPDGTTAAEPITEPLTTEDADE